MKSEIVTSTKKKSVMGPPSASKICGHSLFDAFVCRNYEMGMAVKTDMETVLTHEICRNTL